MIEMELDPMFENIVKPIFAIYSKSVYSSIIYRCTEAAYIVCLLISTVELYGTIFFIVLNLSCLYFWLRVEFTVSDHKDGKSKSK